jgi:hypothetical protein
MTGLTAHRIDVNATFCLSSLTCRSRRPSPLSSSTNRQDFKSKNSLRFLHRCHADNWTFQRHQEPLASSVSEYTHPSRLCYLVGLGDEPYLCITALIGTQWGEPLKNWCFPPKLLSSIHIKHIEWVCPWQEEDFDSVSITKVLDHFIENRTQTSRPRP